MNVLELREAIKTRVCEVAQKQIFEKTISIAQKFGKTSLKSENGYSKTNYDFEVVIDKMKLKIQSSNRIYGHRFVRVYLDNQCVFSAKQVDADYYRGPYDAERLINNGLASRIMNEIPILVEVYIRPTEWVDWLTPEKINKTIENERMLRTQKEEDSRKITEKEALERERTRLLYDFEHELACQFGIQID